MVKNESDFIKTVGVIQPYVEGVIEENYRIRARNERLEAEKEELLEALKLCEYTMSLGKPGLMRARQAMFNISKLIDKHTGSST